MKLEVLMVSINGDIPDEEARGRLILADVEVEPLRARGCVLELLGLGGEFGPPD